MMNIYDSILILSELWTLAYEPLGYYLNMIHLYVNLIWYNITLIILNFYIMDNIKL